MQNKYEVCRLARMVKVSEFYKNNPDFEHPYSKQTQKQLDKFKDFQLKAMLPYMTLKFKEVSKAWNE